jgi:gamma-glutamyltranspeptidase/glutathione hydrolase
MVPWRQALLSKSKQGLTMQQFSPALPYPSQRSPVLARNILATSQPLAAQAGIRMLLAGGNAVDAALAAAITLTVVEPTANGVGGDAFAIVWDGTSIHGLNASGRSPAGWTRERFANSKTMPRRGWDSVTVPGAVSAWLALSERFGKLPFEALFEPAIGYASEGFSVSPLVAGTWQRVYRNYQGQPGFDEAFLPKGRPPEAGETFSFPALAETLRLIAVTRGKAFYEGALAEAMVRHASNNGGAMTLHDLATHRADWTPTITARYGDYALHEIPPNTQGIAALVALKILAYLRVDRFDPDSPESLHLQIEAMKLALADADAFVADPSAMHVSAGEMLDDSYLRARAALIDSARAGDPGAGVPRAGGTVYLAAGDADGMMISYIQSNYEGFGSGVVVPGTGISLHNRGIGFVLDPNHANCVAPGKRPYHSIIPGFATKLGEPVMSYGVMGGPMQAQGHLQLLLRTLVYGQNPQAASDAPRWRLAGGRAVAIEAGTDSRTVAALEALGHLVQREPPEAAWGFGGAQLVCRTGSGYVGGSDHRKDGCVIGF